MVISDTSPLFYLHLVGQLDLLRALYGQVTLPPAVVAELQAGAAKGLAIAPLAQLEWVHVEPVQVPPVLRAVSHFGAGELEVLALALEHPGSSVLLDDGWAREVSRVHGIAATGSAGVLVAAKRRGLIERVEPVLRAMMGHGFWLSETAFQQILRRADEV